jgi:hypothetical protein
MLCHLDKAVSSSASLDQDALSSQLSSKVAFIFERTPFLQLLLLYIPEHPHIVVWFRAPSQAKCEEKRVLTR